MKKFFLVLAVIFLMVDVCSAATMSVAFSGAEVRSKPAVSSSKVLFKVPMYYPVKVIEKGAEYYKISDYRGRQGWLHKSLLSDKPGIVIKGDMANIRKGPGTEHPVLFQLKRGDSGQVLAREEKWVQIRATSGQTGWVADFLTSGL